MKSSLTKRKTNSNVNLTQHASAKSSIEIYTKSWQLKSTYGLIYLNLGIMWLNPTQILFQIINHKPYLLKKWKFLVLIIHKVKMARGKREDRRWEAHLGGFGNLVTENLALDIAQVRVQSDRLKNQSKIQIN